MSAPLRLGFIGGSLESAIGYAHFVACRMDGLFRIDAGCFDRVPQANAATAAAYGVDPARTHADWKDMLAAERGRLDALVVLTPTPTHTEIVVACIEAGYPVICEKALAVSSDECRRIAGALAARKGYLAVTYNYSGYPMVRELRRLVAEGELGRVQQVHIEMPQEGFLRTSPEGAPASPQAWRLHDEAVPTVSLDLGVHVHHMLRFLCPAGRPLELVAEQTRFGHFEGIVDDVSAMLRCEGGLHARFWYGKTALGKRNGLRVRLYGERGAAEWLQTAPESLTLWTRDGTETVLDRSAPRFRLAAERRYNRFKPGHPAGFHEAFANLYADFAGVLGARARGESAQSPYVFGVEHALEGLELLEAIARSARTHQWCTV